MAGKATQKQIIDGLVALFCARAMILAGREALKDTTDIPETLQSILAIGSVLPACALITQTFWTGELRDETFKVVAKITA